MEQLEYIPMREDVSSESQVFVAPPPDSSSECIFC